MTRARDLGDFIADGAAAELVVDTTTLVVDSTNNRVGIGTASPATALDVVGNATITVADNSTNLSLVSTDADASVGPVLDLYRNSASPADDDVLGEIKFHGENDADEKIQYGLIAAKIQDASDGTEDVRLSFKTITAGTERERVTIQPTEVVFNEDSQDLDFRVESDSNSYALFVEGSSGNVGIGTTSPDTNSFGAGHGILAVASATGSAKTAMLNLIGDGNDTADTRVASIFFNDASAEGAGGTIAGVEAYRATNNATDPGATIRFSTNSTSSGYVERLRIADAGQLGIGGANYGTSGQILTSGGASAAPSWADAGGGLSGLNYQVFTSSGTYTPTSGYNYAVVYVTGAGGAGGYSNTDVMGGGGAGSGATALKVYDLSSVTTATVTIGSGGAPTTGTGDQGGQSSFTVGGTALSANGGLGGEKSFGVGGQGSRTTANQDFTINGNSGMGGSTGGARSTGGNGGASFWGGSGQGKVYANGQNGINGGGGGGGGTVAGQTRNGGTGGDGIVVVVEYK